MQNLTTNKTESSTDNINIYVIYDVNDESYFEELEKHLKILERETQIVIWHDKKIPIGANREEVKDSFIENAEIILLLMSSNFISNEDSYNQMKKIITIEGKTIVPILLSPCILPKLVKDKQALPRNNKFINQWENKENAYHTISIELESIINQPKESRTNSYNPTTLALTFELPENGIADIATILKTISEAMNYHNIHLKGIEMGSIKIHLELPKAIAHNLKEMITDGGLREFNIKQIELNPRFEYNTNIIHLNKVKMQGVNLFRILLKGASLEGANFEGANLERANLERANLERANFAGANLYKANFAGANLFLANFEGAIFEGAIFYKTNLQGVDFSDVKLSQVIFSQCKINFSQKEVFEKKGANTIDVIWVDDDSRIPRPTGI